MSRKKIVCPHCGYVMQITYDSTAKCMGVYVRCKGRGCKKEFEIAINQDK